MAVCPPHSPTMWKQFFLSPATKSRPSCSMLLTRFFPPPRCQRLNNRGIEIHVTPSSTLRDPPILSWTSFFFDLAIEIVLFPQLQPVFLHFSFFFELYSQTRVPPWATCFPFSFSPAPFLSGGQNSKVSQKNEISVPSLPGPKKNFFVFFHFEPLPCGASSRSVYPEISATLSFTIFPVVKLHVTLLPDMTFSIWVRRKFPVPTANPNFLCRFTFVKKLQKFFHWLSLKKLWVLSLCALSIH